MTVQLFTGNVIAIIWDFDQTLIPGYMEEPIFKEYNISSETFWREVSQLKEHYGSQDIVVSQDTLYLNHMLTYVKNSNFPRLNNGKLRELGKSLKLYAGMPEFLADTQEFVKGNSKFAEHGITLEHYVVSTGLRQMILGSEVADYLGGVWACEFIEDPALPGFSIKTTAQAQVDATEKEISQVGYFLDDTTKTRAIWEINKGTNKDPNVGVNDLISEAERRVPIRNMIYIADGPSDVPVFSIINRFGGRTLGVYNASQSKHYHQVKKLNDQGRVQHFAPANYEKGSPAYLWIMESLDEIGKLITEDRDRLLVDRVQKTPKHIVS